MMIDKSRRQYLEHIWSRTHFLLGDEACAYGAIYAGCDFFAGYPITPASEVAELIAAELPKAGGLCVQMEDELANIGYAIMTETPCVIVDVQRSGPSTGQATKPAQGDVMQARWGTHGDHEIMALAPSSAQECFDLMFDCFDLADTYRTPVILLMDGEIGHIRESVTMPEPSTVKRASRKRAEPGEDIFGGPELVPGVVHYGEGVNVHVTGSTHLANGMRDVTTPHVHDELVRRLYRKIDENREKIIRVETDISAGGNARIGVISYGATARPAYGAVKAARSEGRDVDMLRLITVWPFAREQVTDFARNLDLILVPEMNLGQMSREIQRFVDCEVVSVPKIGGVPHLIDEIHQAIMEAM
jgi:2-oxoglutarate ferredoxin oxidoreductase subunit alpha